MAMKFTKPPEKVRITMDSTAEKRVRLRFDRPLDTLELEPDEAVAVAEGMLRKAREARLVLAVR